MQQHRRPVDDLFVGSLARDLDDAMTRANLPGKNDRDAKKLRPMSGAILCLPN